MSKQETVGEVADQNVPPRGRHYPGIDGLRTVAVAAVIVFHAVAKGGGFLGVDIFFAISGFVITLTLLREHDKTNHVRLGRFYLRRFWRLTPALVTMIGFAAVVELGAHAVTGHTFGVESAEGITYTYNFFHAAAPEHGTYAMTHVWSLGVEEQFYLLWAPIMAAGLAVVATGAGRLRVIGAAVIVLAVSPAVTYEALDAQAAFYLPWGRMGQLLVGAAVAVALHQRLPDQLTRFFASPIIAVVALLGLPVEMLAFRDQFTAPLYFGGFLAASILAAIVVGHCYVPTGRSPVRAVLEWQPMAWLGRRSYGIYLYHYPIIIALRHRHASHAVSLAVTAVGAVAVAALSYRFIEQPIRKWGTRERATG